jgi:hypothetical protein
VRIVSIVARGDVEGIMMTAALRAAAAAEPAISCKHKMWVDSGGPPR